VNQRDARVPPAELSVIRPLLEQRAAETPDATYVIAPDGTPLTFAAFRNSVIRTANALRALGVRQGDHVVSWLPNGMEPLRLWFALSYLGAVYVPINTAYRGGILQHVVRNSDAKLMIAHAALVARLGEIERTQIEQVVSVGRPAPELAGITVHPADALSSDSTALPPLERPIEPWDTQAIIYTSGTTGPSKGVLSSYMHLYSSMASAESFPYLRGSDRFIVNLPLFHVGATLFIYAMLLRGGSIALVESFESDRFWDVIRRTRTTVGMLLGVMAQFLLKRPPSPEDRDHTLRNVLMVPLTDEAEAFADRFGVDIYTLFNMTETSIPIVSDRNPRPAGTCGRVRPGIEVRLVDEADCEVPVGAVGEMMVRTDAPWAMNHGYYKNPEATAAAWRNGWFHTGDAFRVDADGNYYFVDRIKDAIRRRGENISSFEVEREICAFPAVKEAAVIAARGELSEDEVMAVVAPVAGQSIDPIELTLFLKDRLPYFMIPRYIRVVGELPKTPTQKIQKANLRREGVTPDSWDREADKTVIIKRERLG
jgi:crotonobetaine/carnitine-CoA ligase